MPQVLVINPPNSSSVMDTVACTVTRPDELTDWANVPSLGALTLASALSDIPGITPVYLDGTIIGWPELLTYISDNAADIFAIGVSVLTASYEAGLLLLRQAKQIRPEIWTILGNDHFTALAELCLTRRACVDFGFVGNEVVRSFRNLIGDLYRDGLRSPDAYPGLTARTRGGVVISPQQPEPIYTGQRYELIDAVYPHSQQYLRNFQARVGPRLRELTGTDLHTGVPVEFARGCIKFSRDDACSFCSIQYAGMWRNSVEHPGQAWEVLGRATGAGYDFLSVTADELPLTFGNLLRQMLDSPPGWWRSRPEADRPLMAGYARADGISSPRHAAMLRELNIRYLMVGLDAGAPLSLQALNKPLAPVKDADPAYRAEKMFEHNVRALRTASDEGLLLKAGFVLGHLGMSPDLLKLNVESICTLIDAGRGTIASVDIEVLSPEPGSLDYRYLTQPRIADAASLRLGLPIGDEDVRQEIAQEHARLDVVDREQAMRDYTRAVMPGLTLEDLAEARRTVREHARSAGVVVGD